MSLTGSHECRCGRICNGVREFEKLEAERDALKAELNKCCPSKTGHSEALPTSAISNGSYDGLHNLCNERVGELTAERDALKKTNVGLIQMLENRQKRMSVYREALETISNRICDHNTAPCKSHRLAEKALSGAKGKAE